MTALARRVLRGLRRRSLLNDGERVAIALSGGSDSVALAWLLHEMASAGDVTVAGLVHVNHGLRGEESNGDEAFCRALAARLGWPIDVERIDAAALGRGQSRSVETAARAARYRVFDAAAERLVADVVMTAHTLDDQAETVLLRLLRGAGTRGLTGVRPRRGRYVRPLLEVRRAELRQYLAGRGESFRDDSSNADLAIPRNRIRHELMPVIGRLAPGGVRALARLAALARDDEDFLQKAAIEAGRSLVLSHEAGGASQETPPASTLRVDCRTLAALPPALGRRVVREVLQRAAPGAGFTVRHIEAVRELASADKSNGHLDLPGLAVERRAGLMAIAPRIETIDAKAAHDVNDPRGSRRRLTGVGSRQRALDVPGAVEWPEAGLRIAASLQAGEQLAARGLDKHVAMLQASSLALPLAVRTRRPGDRFRPLGAPGRRKLQDLFVDRKVPRETREIVPLVVDASDRIVWVVGVAIAEECRVTSPGAGVVILEVRDLRN